jgi:hypothetical protein
MQRSKARLVRIGTGLIEALTSVDELFACRSEERWRAFLRVRSGSFGASLLAAAVDRPVRELLADVPQDLAFVAGSLDPKVIATVPELLAHRHDGFLRPFGVNRPEPMALAAKQASEESVEEDDLATAFLAAWTGRFWAAGALDASHVEAPPTDGKFSFATSAIGDTQLALLFERTEEAEGADGFVPLIVNTLVPKAWRAPLQLAAISVYRPVPLDHALLEVVASDPATAVRTTRGRIAAARLPLANGPERAFLVVRTAPSDRGAGDLFAMRADAGVELLFGAPER